MESAAALEKTYGFAHEKLVEYMNTMIIGRFTKPGMSDPISRVAREPIRKISANDRIMGPAIRCEELGLDNTYLLKGCACALKYVNEEDPQAVGMAKAAKFLDKDINVYTLCGDGEMAEGQIWEAAMSAAHYGLDNLCVFVDVNGLQIDGRTYEVMNTEPLDDKFRAFGFHVIQIDGHDLDELEYAGQRFHDLHGTGVPTAVLMKTVKGKGISYMEDQAGWHGKAPNEEQYRLGMVELSKARRKIEEA